MDFELTIYRREARWRIAERICQPTSGILLGQGCVANQQDKRRPRTIASSWRRRRMTKPSGNQARVIRGPDDDRHYLCRWTARDAPEQIVFFVGRAVRSDESNGVRAIRLVNFGEAPRNLRQSVFPARWLEFAIAAHQRKLQSFGMFGEIKSEAALHAQEIFVEAGKIAIIGAQDFVIADAERGLAAVRAVRTYGGDVGHLPRAGFVAIGAAGECSTWADIDAHPAIFSQSR